jgi:hypothetical protein
METQNTAELDAQKIAELTAYYEDMDDWQIEEIHSKFDVLTMEGQLALIAVRARRGIDREKMRKEIEEFERLEREGMRYIH